MEGALPTWYVLRPLRAAVPSGAEGPEFPPGAGLLLYAGFVLFLPQLHLCPLPHPEGGTEPRSWGPSERNHTQLREEKSTALPTRALTKCTFERGRTTRGDTAGPMRSTLQGYNSHAFPRTGSGQAAGCLEEASSTNAACNLSTGRQVTQQGHWGDERQLGWSKKVAQGHHHPSYPSHLSEPLPSTFEPALP